MQYAQLFAMQNLHVHSKSYFVTIPQKYFLITEEFVSFNTQFVSFNNHLIKDGKQSKPLYILTKRSIFRKCVQKDFAKCVELQRFFLKVESQVIP